MRYRNDETAGEHGKIDRIRREGRGNGARRRKGRKAREECEGKSAVGMVEIEEQIRIDANIR